MASMSRAARALEAAGVVGTWETDVDSGLSILDRPAAGLLAGDRALAGRPLPLERALARIDPRDRDWVFDRIHRVRRTGGPFSAEFRVLDEAGGTRWVMNRGSLAPDDNGAMRGRGAYIDTTDSHRGAFYAVPGSSSAQAPQDTPAPPPIPDPAIEHLSEAAMHCIQARESVRRSGHGFLRLLADMLLWEIGRALAARRLS